MDKYAFQQAVPVWCREMHNQYNQFAGFYTSLQLDEEKTIKIAVAARSYYRLYINGVMAANGPARTAVHYCRVDELTYTVAGNVSIAIEVAALNIPDRYSNDCTLEPGILNVEITDEKGNVLSATGKEGWLCKELDTRRSLVETMSHSRGIMEVYDLDEHSYDWITGSCEGMEAPVAVEEEIIWLKRRAPYAQYRPIPMQPLSQVSDWERASEIEEDPDIYIIRRIIPKWYSILPEDQYFVQQLQAETDRPFSGKLFRKGRQTIVTPGKAPVALTYHLPQSELGFLNLKLTVERDCILDVISSDHKEDDGSLPGNTYVIRYHLKQGSYDLTSFNPKLVRYVKLVLRTEGEVTVDVPVILEYTYPDNLECTFECSDGDVNRIYQAARRTLRFNTMDIFMDCPERERGGWLCDSQFAGRGAWQMFGDLTVEKDFIENFLLTDGKEMRRGFFPEVYPACKSEKGGVGIENWSFFLMTELYDYHRRSNDRAFVEEHRDRVACFVEGMLELRGESGLIEKMEVGFVDWSLSNRSFAQKPINIPINCLAVCMLEKLAELYQVPEWQKVAEDMRSVLDQVSSAKNTLYGGEGDGAVYENGILRRTDCLTEAGVALELWSGFHLDDPAYMRKFVETMGYSPKRRSNPNIGKANIFIGVMFRLEMLERLDLIEILLKELKDLYLAELKDGSGTLFENYNYTHGCHGINGAVGAMLTEHVLGLGHPVQSTKTIRIAPRACGLNWAMGTAKCEDGMFYMDWKADELDRRMEINLQIPEGWTPEFDFGNALKGWNVTVNQEPVII